MLKMNQTGTVYSGDFTSSVYRLDEVSWFVFAITATTWTNGTITVQFAPDFDAVVADRWETLDSVNLVFTAEGARAALFGDCYIRCIGTGTVAGSRIEPWIGGANVYRPPAVELTALGEL